MVDNFQLEGSRITVKLPGGRSTAYHTSPKDAQTLPVNVPLCMLRAQNTLDFLPLCADGTSSRNI